MAKGVGAGTRCQIPLKQRIAWNGDVHLPVHFPGVGVLQSLGGGESREKKGGAAVTWTRTPRTRRSSPLPNTEAEQLDGARMKVGWCVWQPQISLLGSPKPQVLKSHFQRGSSGRRPAMPIPILSGLAWSYLHTGWGFESHFASLI